VVEPSGQISASSSLMKRQSSPMLRVGMDRRVVALTRSMGNDFLLREQFVTDPAQIMSEYVQGASIPSDQASVANQLVYAFMANATLRRWLSEYAVEQQGRVPPRAEFLGAFAKAVANHGDEHLAVAMIRATSEPTGAAAFETFEWVTLSLLSIFTNRGAGPTGGPPTGGPPTGGPPTGGPPTGGPPTGGPPTGGPPTGGPPTGGPPTGGPPTGGPPTGGPPTGGPPTGGPPTGSDSSFRRPDYVELVLNELVEYSGTLLKEGTLSFLGTSIE
jgi:hypothetical protein